MEIILNYYKSKNSGCIDEDVGRRGSEQDSSARYVVTSGPDLAEGINKDSTNFI